MNKGAICVKCVLFRCLEAHTTVKAKSSVQHLVKSISHSIYLVMYRSFKTINPTESLLIIFVVTY